MLFKTSLSGTEAIFLFGISIPTVLLPGIGASILTSLAASARAISLLILVILLTLVPALISTSNWVTAGPSWIATTLPVIWKSLSTFSRAIRFWFKNSVVLPLVLFLTGFKISNDGSLYSPAWAGVLSTAIAGLGSFSGSSVW